MHSGPFIFWPIWCVLHLTKWSAINVKHIIELVNVIDELFVINMDILACYNYIWTQRCSFCNLPQSHHRSKMFTANFSGRHRCLGFRDSSTMKIVLCRSNSIVRLLIFFNTKFMALIRFVIIWPYCHLLSQAIVHFLFGIFSSQSTACLFSFIALLKQYVNLGLVMVYPDIWSTMFVHIM